MNDVLQVANTRKENLKSEIQRRETERQDVVRTLPLSLDSADGSTQLA